ncbi:MAG: dihydrolipoamide acyltransferase [Firmicutes bacterium]|nr:dihydrolipoamide acyltransferase [Bacillota bacterium]
MKKSKFSMKDMIGRTYSFEFFISDNHTDRVSGSGDLDILSMSALTIMMEHAAYVLLEEVLEEGQTSVGTDINITHTPASPVGIIAAVEAKIVSVRSGVFVFEVSASDEAGDICSGTHTRTIVDKKEFIKEANMRRTANN